MNCYEHDGQHGTETAVAVCPHCGAGLCIAHLVECRTTPVGHSGLGNPTVHPTRCELCCSSCREAAACPTAA